MKIPEPVVRLPYRRGSVEFCLGSEADHDAVMQTLAHVYPGIDRENFLSALGEPTYLPEQRILAKVDGRVVSHAYLADRTIRYGSGATLTVQNVMWVGTLPEYRSLGFAQNLIRLADGRGRESGAVLQVLTTKTPAFYGKFGYGTCGRQTIGQALSRNLPQVSDGVTEGRGGFWHVRPWRQVELGDLMDLYDAQFARTTGTVVRSEDYWRWIIGRRFAHVIWVACQGDTVRGYAFVKDHRVLEIATDPAHPMALRALLGRVRAEALERAYPQVIVHAPPDHPVIEAIRQASGKVTDLDEAEGSVTMYHIPSPERFLTEAMPELIARVEAAQPAGSVELGLTVDDRRWLLHVERDHTRVEPDKLSRRHLTLSASTLVRLVLGQVGIDQAVADEGVESSTGTALEAARILFPNQPVWRSPLDAPSP